MTYPIPTCKTTYASDIIKLVNKYTGKYYTWEQHQKVPLWKLCGYDTPEACVMFAVENAHKIKSI